MIQQTSRQAYYSLKDLGARQYIVLKTIQLSNSICNLDIAKLLVIPINQVTPRTNELVKEGLVEESHKDIGPTGRRVIFWKLSEEGEKLFAPHQEPLF